MDYTHLLSDPNFKNFINQQIESQGYKKEEIVPKKNSYTIILNDGIKREASWSFVHFSCLSNLMLMTGIDKLDPMNNWMHFALILYSTMLPGMFNSESNEPTESHLTFDAFVEMIPIEEHKLQKLIVVMQTLLSENKELIII